MEAERAPDRPPAGDDPTRVHREEVFRYYELAKRAEWQVRDLPWGEVPPT